MIDILNREAAAIEKFQDAKTGVWWDIIDLGGKEKNYLESSASAMFVYALARGVREGYLPEKYMKVATRGWEGIKKEFIKTNAKGETDWEGTVSVSGLGGNPYRDGSFEYYMSEKLRTNDAKGLGPAIRAALEMEAYERGWAGRGKTVLLDDHFNHEIRKSKNTGGDESWHYKWDERPDAGVLCLESNLQVVGCKNRNALGGSDGRKPCGCRRLHHRRSRHGERNSESELHRTPAREGDRGLGKRRRCAHADGQRCSECRT